jgi:HD-GYP domain-containing protein (c-di-GMP phosphodiesterase class II)
LKDQLQFIEPRQLCVGLYVHLDLGWAKRPFMFSSFKIQSEDQVRKLRQLGLDKIRYDPERSDCEPLPIYTSSAKKSTDEQAAPAEPSKTPQQRRLEHLKQMNAVIRICEKSFAHDVSIARKLVRDLSTQPDAAVEEAETLVDRLVNSAVTKPDSVLHAVSGHHTTPDDYEHALNVAVLSLMLAKEIGVTASDARELGLAALFHDISNEEVPRYKSFIDQRCENRVRTVKEAGLSDTVQRLIMQHMEHVDGSGSPSNLTGEEMDPLAKVLSVVYAYNSLCNPNNPDNAMTPFEAITHMYATDHEKYDPQALSLLMKMLGIYPPGSIVQLSNGTYSIVLSMNPNQPQLPIMRVHHPTIPRETPLMIDLSKESGITMKNCMPPHELPREVFEYLRPTRRVSYYFVPRKMLDQPLPGIAWAHAPQ